MKAVVDKNLMGTEKGVIIAFRVGKGRVANDVMSNWLD